MFNKLKVADVMTREVSTVYEEDNLERVLGLLAPYRFRHVPVVDDGRVVGILSQRDLLQLTSQGRDHSAAARARQAHALEQTFVRDVMNQKVITIRCEASLGEAAKLMLEHRVGALPVVDDQERLIGIVSESDLLRRLAQAL
ncbi:MAG TPA: CBS domain-containing protein [Polyangiales bacterium]|nr:CBS domain-containing protein [Polyangiales bacterium]